MFWWGWGCQVRKTGKKAGESRTTWTLLIRKQRVLQSSLSSRPGPLATFRPGGHNYSLCDHSWFPTWPFMSVTHNSLFSGTFSLLPDGKSPVSSLQNYWGRSLSLSLPPLPLPNPIEWLVRSPYPLDFQRQSHTACYTHHIFPDRWSPLQQPLNDEVPLCVRRGKVREEVPLPTKYFNSFYTPLPYRIIMSVLPVFTLSGNYATTVTTELVFPSHSRGRLSATGLLLVIHTSCQGSGCIPRSSKLRGP